MTTKTAKRPPTWATQLRRALRESARGPAALAVARVRDDRHRDHGLSIGETGYASLAVAFVAGGWMPPEPELARSTGHLDYVGGRVGYTGVTGSEQRTESGDSGGDQ